MNQTGFNVSTVPWNRGAEIDQTSRPEFQADASDIATYQRDGVIRLPGLFTDWVDKLRSGLQRNMDDPQSYAFPCESNPEGQPGRFFDSYCNWQLIPEYLDFVAHSCAASLAGRFMESSVAQFFHEHAFCKTPGTQRATPWHQDLPYYCVDGGKTITVYISLDHADEDVAVRFIRGSHRWNQLYYPRVFEDGADFNENPDSEMKTASRIENNLQDYDVLGWALEPGDAVLFDFRTLHGTGDAEIKSPRRAFSTRWLGDGAHYCERSGETSPPYQDHGMKHGDPMRQDWFPILWSI